MESSKMSDLTEADIQAALQLLGNGYPVVTTALKNGTDRPGGRRMDLPPNTLNNSLFDLFRKGDYHLSCNESHSTGETCYLVKKKVLATAGCCYHATPAGNAEGILRDGLKIGRSSGKTSTPGSASYTDSCQYIHVTKSTDDAVIWFYGILGFTGAGAVLEIDLGSANLKVIGDPRSDDGIIDATIVAPQYVRLVEKLPSISDIKGEIAGLGLTIDYEGNETGTLTIRNGKGTRTFSGLGIDYKINHAWWQVHDKYGRELGDS